MNIDGIDEAMGNIRCQSGHVAPILASFDLFATLPMRLQSANSPITAITIPFIQP